MRRIFHSEMPFLLRQIPSCPLKLYFNGDQSLLYKKCITIVGTRKITSYGRWCIERFLDSLPKELDICIVSGMALGVDTYVHQSCLKRGLNTIGVVPGNLESVRSSTNKNLFDAMERKGLILAEFGEGISLQKRMFVLRNRLLAGISPVTVVVEAGLKSGSLITAKFALEFNRDIFVFPGNINNKMSHGCNALIREGAEVISCVDDIKGIFSVHHGQVNFLRGIGV